MIPTIQGVPGWTLRTLLPTIQYEKFNRALCVLDPYGLHLDWEIIELAGKSRAVDMFLNFPVMDMNRNAIWRNPDKAPAGGLDRINKFWGDDSWRNAAYAEARQRSFFGPELVKQGNEEIVAAFLAHTKTFHDIYAPLTAPAVSPILTFLVSWGHLLIGLSLISGLLVRVSGVFGVALLLTYWTAHMDFPYIENVNSYLVDYHIVYCGVLVYLIVKRAGHVFGLDGWVSSLAMVQQAPALRWMTA